MYDEITMYTELTIKKSVVLKILYGCNSSDPTANLSKIRIK